MEFIKLIKPLHNANAKPTVFQLTNIRLFLDFTPYAKTRSSDPDYYHITLKPELRKKMMETLFEPTGRDEERESRDLRDAYNASRPAESEPMVVLADGESLTVREAIRSRRELKAEYNIIMKRIDEIDKLEDLVRVHATPEETSSLGMEAEIILKRGIEIELELKKLDDALVPDATFGAQTLWAEEGDDLVISSPVEKSLGDLFVPAFYPAINMVDGMVVMSVEDIRYRVERTMVNGEHVTKTIQEKGTDTVYLFRGYVWSPRFFIKTFFEGRRLTSEKFNENDFSIPPVSRVSLQTYVEHCSSFTTRVRGKPYCIFYAGTDPMTADVVAADETTIYNLTHKHRSGESRTLDSYTERALLWIFNLSKINTSPNANERVNLNDSTHGIYTYLLVVVKKPDDVFYNPRLPYDVVCLNNNIFPRFATHAITHRPMIEHEQGRRGENEERKVPVPDRLWPAKFIDFGGHGREHESDRSHLPSRSTIEQEYAGKRSSIEQEYDRRRAFNRPVPEKVGNRNPLRSVEVYDKRNKSIVVYCTREEFLIEMIVGQSLNVKDVFARLVQWRRNRNSVIQWKDYSSGRYYFRKDSDFLHFIQTRFRSPYLMMLIDDSISQIPVPPRVIRQKCEEIAYTIFCKMKDDFDKGIGHLPYVFNHWTDQITFAKNVSLKKPRFIHLESREINDPDDVKKALTHHENGFKISCFVERDEPGKVFLRPIDGQSFSRLLTAPRNEVDWVLVDIYSQAGTGLVTLRRPKSGNFNLGRISEDHEKALHVEVPEELMHSIIVFLRSGLQTSSKSAGAGWFIEAVMKMTMRRNADKAYTVMSKEGLDVKMTANGYTVTDNMNKRAQTKFPLVFEQTVEIKTVRIRYEEPGLKSLFVSKGKLDMTAIYMLFEALGEPMETFFSLFPGRSFSDTKLATFLYRILIKPYIDDGAFPKTTHRLVAVLNVLDTSFEMRVIDNEDFIMSHQAKKIDAFVGQTVSDAIFA